MKCIVVELASVWAVVQVEPARLLATCQHKEYATHIAGALEEYQPDLVFDSDEGQAPAVIGFDTEPEPRCARCGQSMSHYRHIDADNPDNHPFELPGGDAPKLTP